MFQHKAHKQTSQMCCAHRYLADLCPAQEAFLGAQGCTGKHVMLPHVNKQTESRVVLDGGFSK